MKIKTIAIALTLVAALSLLVVGVSGSQSNSWKLDCYDPGATGTGICKDGHTAVSTCKDMCEKLGDKCDPNWSGNSVSNCKQACTTGNGCTNF